MNNKLYRSKRWQWALWFIIPLLIGYVLTLWLLYRIEQHDVQQTLQEVLQHPVSVQSHQLNWEMYRPVIRINQLQTQWTASNYQYELQIEHVDCEPDWWQSLRTRNFVLSKLVLHKPILTVKPLRSPSRMATFTKAVPERDLSWQRIASLPNISVEVKKGALQEIKEDSLLPLLANIHVHLKPIQAPEQAVWVDLQTDIKQAPSFWQAYSLPIKDTKLQGQWKILLGDSTHLKALGQVVLQPLDHDRWFGVQSIEWTGQVEQNNQIWQSQFEMTLTTLKNIKEQLKGAYDEKTERLSLYTKRFGLKALQSLVEQTQIEGMEAFKLKLHDGYLEDLSLDVEMKDKQPTWQLRTAFKEIAIKHPDYFSLKQLEGSLLMFPNKGELVLNSGLKLKPLCNNKEKGTGKIILSWQSAGNDYSINLDSGQLQICAHDIQIQGKAKYSENQLRDIVINSNVEHPSLALFVKPWVAHMNKDKFRQWLERALDVSIPFKGKLKYESPKLNLESLHKDVVLQAEIPNYTFLFEEDWFPLKDTDATIHYHKNTLTIELQNGTVGQVPVKRASATMNLEKGPHSKVKVIVESDTKFQDLLKMLKASPIRQSIPEFAPFSMNAEGHLHLVLDIPLPKPDRVGVMATMDLKDGVSQIQGQQKPFVEQFIGQLTVKQDVGSSQQNQQLQIHLKGNGSLHLRTNNDKHYLQYKTAMNVDYITKKEDWYAHYQVDFEQLQHDLPFDINLIRNQLVKLDLKGYVSPNHTTIHWKMGDGNKGELTFYSQKKELKNVVNLDVQGNIKRWYFDEYAPLIDFVKSSLHSNEIGLMQYPVKTAELNIDELWMFQQQFNQVKLKRIQLNPDWLMYEFNGPSIQGNVWNHVPYDNYLVALKDLRIKQTFNDDNFILKPQKVPNITAWIDRIHENKNEIGKLDFQLITKPELYNQSLQQSNFTSQLEQRGVTPLPQTKPLLKAQLKAKNISKFLNSISLFKKVSSQSGTIEVNVNFDKNLTQVRIEDYVGKAGVQLRSGNVNLDKGIGGNFQVGRLLSFLNVDTLPKRFLLDFRDVTESKYFFDTMWCELSLNRGLLNAKQWVFQGSSADIYLAGLIDMKQQTLDMQATLIPKLTSGLPIVATIAGGPVLGVTTWVANGIFGNNLNQLNAYRYQLKGPWKSLSVSQMKKRTS